MKDKPVRPIDAALARLRSTYTPGQGRPSEDVEANVEADLDENVVPPAGELFWPPPGLEKIHGELPRLTGDFAVGAAILILTVFWLGFVVDDPRNLGGSGAMVAVVIGFLLLVRAYARLRQFLMHAYVGITQGYPRSLVWRVAADRHRDMLLLLQGEGYYASVTKSEITQFSSWRVASSVLALFAWLWVLISFPFITVFGFFGWLRDTAAWLMLLAPPALLVASSVYLQYQEWRARQKFRTRDVLEREVAAQASGWMQLFAALGMRRPRSKSTLELKLAMGAVWLAAFILLIPIALTVITTAIPRSIGGGSSGPGLAGLELLQPHRTPANAGISAIDAGRALQNLRYTGVDPRTQPPIVQRPTRQYPPVFDTSEWARLENPEIWPDSLFGWMWRHALTNEQRRIVERAARHPAAPDFRLLAAARSIDIPGTRWNLAVADRNRSTSLPWESSRPLREVTQARLAAAALAFERGAVDSAEATLGEIISVGFLLRDEAATMPDAIHGFFMLRMGGLSLAALYEQTDRIPQGAQIREAIRQATQNYLPRESGRRGLAAAYAYVLDERNPRAARWQVFADLQTAAPCMSLYAGIFGPTKEHEEWVEHARKALVRTPSEAQYFRLVDRNHEMLRRPGEEPRCAHVLRAFRSLLTGY